MGAITPPSRYGLRLCHITFYGTFCGLVVPLVPRILSAGASIQRANTLTPPNDPRHHRVSPIFICPVLRRIIYAVAIASQSGR